LSDESKTQLKYHNFKQQILASTKCPSAAVTTAADACPDHHSAGSHGKNESDPTIERADKPNWFLNAGVWVHSRWPATC